jgi:type IV pilus assembly protein PilY1
LFTRIQPPPANIVILLDDSGSMSYSVGIRGTYDGRYPNPDEAQPEQDGYCYIFDNLGDSVYTNEERYFRAEGRKYWKSQWYKTNVMYYNPHTHYEPWPSTATYTFGNADPAHPRPHPVLFPGVTLDIHAESFRASGQYVDHAHYFVWSETENRPYLVEMEDLVDGIIYLNLEVIGSNLAEKVTNLMINSSPPDDVRPKRKQCGADPDTEEYCSYTEELQNFANWYTYSRRREYVAKAALARVIKNLEAVRVGILGINGKIKIPLQPVKAKINDVLQDETDTLLDALYAFQSKGGTPLKEGLDTVGQYFEKNTGILDGVSGDLPYPDDGGACQQAFTIVMTDGYYSDTNYNASADNADGDDDVPYADGYSDTLADIAMYYYENDLSDYDNQLPTNKYDKADHQHMVTYGVAFGVVGTLDPADYELDPTHPDYLKHKVSGDYVSWPLVSGVRQPESIDDLWHAAVNGRGEFLNAANPQELVDSLTAVMESISKRHRGSAAAVGINADQIFVEYSDEIRIYQSSYSNYNDEWTGDVKAFLIDKFTGEVFIDTPQWSAAEALEAKDPDERLILSYNGEDAGIEFIESALTPAQKAALGADVTNKVAYLRGQAVVGFRNRSQKLGDIVHSSPVFNEDILYVGANDGMLHAFNTRAPTSGSDPVLGEEIFAYIPNLVFGNLSELTDTDYTHKFFVNSTPAVKEGKGVLGGEETKTLLVGGLGKGGKGFFALDVSEPRSMTAAKVKWEFPNANTPSNDAKDMGYSYARPVIVRSYNNSHPWIVIAANGYASKNGKSVLFILNPLNGSVIQKIIAVVGPDNGLSAPVAVDVNLDKKVDFVYAGDLKGNLWKFDLTAEDFNQWDVAYKFGEDPTPLFIARGPEAEPADAIQPITAKPDVMLHPNKDGYMVCFGTGKFLGDSDYDDRTINTLYGLWDYGDRVFRFPEGWSHDDNSEFAGEFVSRSEASGVQQLSNQPTKVKELRQQADDYVVDVEGREVEVRIVSQNTPLWITEDDLAEERPDPTSITQNNIGWYLDLSEGERVIADVLLRAFKLIAIGFVPDDSRCAHGGNSWFMEVDASTGGGFNAPVFDLNNDGTVSGGTIEDPGDDVVIETPTGPKKFSPTGLKFKGNLWGGPIIDLPTKPGDDDDDDDDDDHDDDDDNRKDCGVEAKILSSSTGGVPNLIEVKSCLGVLYWKEMQQ